MTGVATDRFWQDRRVFLTGGTGLVGGWLTRRLVAEGADVVVLVRDWVPRSQLLTSGVLASVTVVRGDLCDQELLERTIGEYEVDTVIHLAAQTIVGIANRNPISTFETNIAGTWRLFEACRRSPTVRQIVFASSDKAYGEAEVLPYDEGTPLNGLHPYDASKSCADLIAQTYAKTWKLPVAITRCGNFFGGGDLNWNRVVPGTVRSVLRGEAPVIRSDGTLVRDYIYVEDAVSAYMKLARALAERPELAGQAFNFSTETPQSVREVVGLILRLMDSDLEPVVLNQASNEIPQQYLNAAKARRELGWEAAFGLEEGMRRTIDWYRAHFAQAQA